MASGPRMNALFFDIPGFSLLTPDAQGKGEEDARAGVASTTSTGSSSLMVLGRGGGGGGLLLSGANSTSSSTVASRKRRREEDYFFSNKDRGNARRPGQAEVEAEEALEAEAMALEIESPWQCSACTVINVPERTSCKTCGQTSRRRERLLERAAKQAALALERTMTTQKAVLDSMKDLDDDLEDLDDDDDEEQGQAMDVVAMTKEGEGGKKQASCGEGGGLGGPKGATIQSRGGGAEGVVAVVAAQAGAAVLPAYYHGVAGSPIKACSNDMLLSCLSFLADAKTYADLRGVCKAWGVVAEHEQLWRPLAEAQCRAALTKAGSKAEGKGAPCKDEGGGEMATAAAAAAGGSSGSSSQQSPATMSPPAAGAVAGGGGCASAGKKPPSWMCKACGLIQADPHGLFCEFCNTQREIISSPPAAWEEEAAPPPPPPPSYYTKLSSHQDFAAVWGHASNSSQEAVPLWSELERRQKEKAPTTTATSSSSSSASEGGGGRVYMAGATREMMWEVACLTGDYYMLMKMYYTDRLLADKWETLHRGWEWLVNAARTALRTRLYSDQDAINARNDSCLPIIESFQKVVNKLTRRDWLLIYECMRTEFALQSEALRRDIMREMRERRVGEMGPVRGYRLFLEDLLLAWDKYSTWVFELQQHFGRLNDQVCGERYRSTTAFLPSCGFVEAHTPYLGEGALLSFRDEVMLHHSLKAPLLRAIDGDSSLPLSYFFGGGTDEEGLMGGEQGGASGNGKARDEAVRRQLWEAEREEEEGMLEEEYVLATTGGGGGGAGGRRNRAGSFSSTSSSSSQRRRVVENLGDLIERLGKAAEELDVADDPQAVPPRREQYRRVVLMPLRIALGELRMDAGLKPHGAPRGGAAMVQQQGSGKRVRQQMWGVGKQERKRSSRGGGWGVGMEEEEECMYAYGQDEADRGEALLKGCG